MKTAIIVIQHEFLSGKTGFVAICEPTDVLNTLKEQDCFISIHETINQGFVVVSIENDQWECNPHHKVGKTLREALDQMILFALELIE